MLHEAITSRQKHANIARWSRQAARNMREGAKLITLLVLRPVCSGPAHERDARLHRIETVLIEFLVEGTA